MGEKNTVSDMDKHQMERYMVKYQNRSTSDLCELLCKAVDVKFFEIMDADLVKLIVRVFNTNPREKILDEFKEGFQRMGKTNSSYMTAVFACLFLYDAAVLDHTSHTLCISDEQMKEMLGHIKYRIFKDKWTNDDDEYFKTQFKTFTNGFTSDETVTIITTAIEGMKQEHENNKDCDKRDLEEILHDVQTLMSDPRLVDRQIMEALVNNKNTVSGLIIDLLNAEWAALTKLREKGGSNSTEQDKVKLTLQMILTAVQPGLDIGDDPQKWVVNILTPIDQLMVANGYKLAQFASYVDSKLSQRQPVTQQQITPTTVSSGIEPFFYTGCNVETEHKTILNDPKDIRPFAYSKKRNRVMVWQTPLDNGTTKSYRYSPY
jgi:hypothetical protein